MLRPAPLAKLAGEGYCRSFSAVYGLETVALRYFNVFGPRQDPLSQYAAVVPNFLTAALEGRTITIHGDGTQSRDFTFVENVVAANLAAMSADGVSGRAYNVACGERISLNELIEQLRQVTGREHLILQATLQGLPGSTRKQRAQELLERVGLTEAADRRVGGYSGGMKRRLDLALALVHSPKILFLDEPTTGLDPRSRSELWEVLRRLVREGTTLLLTTQYLEEADQLADNIVVIDRGTVIAEGTPLQLKDQSGAASLVVTVSRPDDLELAEKMLRDHVAEVHTDRGSRQLTAPAEGVAHMTRIAGIFAESRIELDDIGLKRPSLDDVFLHLTGHRAEDASADQQIEEAS